MSLHWGFQLLVSQNQNLNRDTWVIAEAEIVCGEMMSFQEQKEARAERTIKSSLVNAVETAGNFYIPGFGVVHTAWAFSVHALFGTYWPLWQRTSSLCANCFFNMLMSTSLSMLLAASQQLGRILPQHGLNEDNSHLRACGYSSSENLLSSPGAQRKLQRGV